MSGSIYLSGRTHDNPFGESNALAVEMEPLLKASSRANTKIARSTTIESAFFGGASFPSEIKKRMFEMIDESSLRQLAGVSRRCQTLSDHAELWVKLTLMHSPNQATPSDANWKALYRDRNKSASKKCFQRVNMCFSRCCCRNARHPFEEGISERPGANKAFVDEMRKKVKAHAFDPNPFIRKVLPDELEDGIINLLDMRSLCSLAMASRRFRILSDQAEVWQRLCLQDAPDRTPPEDGHWKTAYSIPRNFDPNIDRFREKHKKDTRIIRNISIFLDVGFDLVGLVCGIASSVIGGSNFSSKVERADRGLALMTMMCSFSRHEIYTKTALLFRTNQTHLDVARHEYDVMQNQSHNRRVEWVAFFIGQSILSSWVITLGWSGVIDYPLPSKLLMIGGVIGVFQGMVPSIEIKERVFGFISAKTSSLCIRGSEKAKGCFQRAKRRRSVCNVVTTCFSSCFGRIRCLFLQRIQKEIKESCKGN